MKILAFSSIRSDYDLLSPLYKLLDSDPEIDFRILVSGAHLSPYFGYTIQEIKKDGFKILAQIETLLSSDSKISRVKSTGILLQNSLEVIQDFNPDLILYAGDREDVIIYAIMAGYLEIPSIHFYGGDHVQDSHIDNPIRHATSKLSSVHFVSCEEHKRRLIAMGENEKRIFNTGSIALDKFKAFNPLSKSDIAEYFKVSQLDDFALVIFHSFSPEFEISNLIFKNILESLEEVNIKAFVSYPNIDNGNYKIIKEIEKIQQKCNNFIFYKNLKREIFLSIYHHSKFIIGNSSSGICEAASIPIPAINVGLRQTSRMADKNVIFIGTDKNSIKKTIKQVLDINFLNSIKNIQNSYGTGYSARKAFDLIKTLNFKEFLAKNEDPI
ncbi:UDP-N-acetylglucosamine 2-epimerase (hydrolyzing) [Campylobacter coli]|nr:UDP-N-acetylglucosamine 2-epimerase (hydrolyzing) [Campylobacter coli]EAJ2845519.1 UDP-N-acetylglucosamine 2-epimerase (hydrolyzing) [Campylobacter coli]